MEFPDNPILTERILAKLKESIIVKIDMNVHIHDSDVKRFLRFQILVVSNGYLEKKYSCP